MVTFKISIDGMHCESCVDKIKSALNATPTVANCRISLPDERAIVTFDSDQPDVTKAIEAIQGQGFNVTGYAAVASS